MEFLKKEDKHKGWRKRFAFFPIDFDDRFVWLDWYWARFEGLYTNIALITEKPWEEEE